MNRVALLKLKSKLDEISFFEKYYDKKPLFLKNIFNFDKKFDQSYFSHFLKTTYIPLDSVYCNERFDKSKIESEILANKENKSPEAQINGQEILYRVFNMDHSIIINNVDKYDHYWRDVKHSLSEIVQSPALIHMYFTPNQEKAITTTGIHDDTMNIFTLQLYGKKKWQIYSPVFEKPTREDRYMSERVGLKNMPLNQLELVLQETIEPGDFLYIPRGFPHVAFSSSEGGSLSCAQGFKDLLYEDIFQKAISRASLENDKDIHFRKLAILNDTQMLKNDSSNRINYWNEKLVHYYQKEKKFMENFSFDHIKSESFKNELALDLNSVVTLINPYFTFEYRKPKFYDDIQIKYNLNDYCETMSENSLNVISFLHETQQASIQEISEKLNLKPEDVAHFIWEFMKLRILDCVNCKLSMKREYIEGENYVY